MLFLKEDPFVRQGLHAYLDIRNSSHDLYKPLQSRDSRLFFILSAKGSMVINGESYPLHDNMAILFKAGTPYEWRIEKADYYALNFDFSLAFSHIRQTFHPLSTLSGQKGIIFDCGNIEDCPALNSPIVISKALFLKNKIQNIVAESAIHDQWRDPMLSILLKQVLLEILRQTIQESTAKRTNQSVKAVIAYVQDHYTQPLNNADVAAHFGYCPTYLGRIFKQYTGTTLHDYLTDLRLLSATEALRDSTIPISQICFQSGFQDIYHFSKIFKKKIGMTPSEYRKQGL